MFKSFVVSSLTIAVLCAASTLQARAAAPVAAKNDAAVKAGQEVFTKNCFGCHSVIEGQQRFGPSLYGEMKPPHPKKTAPQVRLILENGKEGTIGKMPSFKSILTKEDTDNLLAYLRTL